MSVAAAMSLGADEKSKDEAVLRRHLERVDKEVSPGTRYAQMRDKTDALFNEMGEAVETRDRMLGDLGTRVQRLEERVTAVEGGSCCWNILAIIGSVVLAILALLTGAFLITKAVR